MLKKVIIFFIIIIFLAAIGVYYANKVFLPNTIKSLIVKSLEESTQKKVSLGSVRLNIFKGLVIRDLKISDDLGQILSLKEGDCTFLFWPFFTKQIIFPSIVLRSPVVYLERREDNTLNILGLFKIKKSSGKNNLKFAIYKIVISKGTVFFQDNAVAPRFKKAIQNLDLVANLSLPASIKFSAKAEIEGRSPAKVNLSGTFRIPNQQLSGRAVISNLSADEYAAYLSLLGIASAKGNLNIEIGSLALNNGEIVANLTLGSNNLVFSKGKITYTVNSQIKAKIEHNLKNRSTSYSGHADIAGLDIAGLKMIKNLTGIKGIVKFDNHNFESDGLIAKVLGFPIEARINFPIL
ncbi:MAG: DUF748 domain-containing protein, partial [Candidatus Omnitrophica bacterium]|nr:DUF748 domain-containing protein [Candidatus Omnitrophota bacterium]